MKYLYYDANICNNRNIQIFVKKTCQLRVVAAAIAIVRVLTVFFDPKRGAAIRAKNSLLLDSAAGRPP